MPEEVYRRLLSVLKWLNLLNISQVGVLSETSTRAKLERFFT